MKKYKVIKKADKPLVSNRLASLFICAAMVLIIFGLFFVSVFDTDKTVSEKENRTLKQRPKFSINAVINGNYNTEFDEYYSDTFPFRDKLLTVNAKISKLFSQTRSTGSGDMVIVDVHDKDDFAGQSID